MAIDITVLISKADIFLPSGNILTDAQMTSLAQYIITKVGDEDENEAEILCKFLEAVAVTNYSQAVVDAVPITSEKAKNYQVTYDSSLAKNAWRDFKDNLKFVCPIFGYYPNTQVGVKIATGELVNVFSNCEDTSVGYL